MRLLLEAEPGKPKQEVVQMVTSDLDRSTGLTSGLNRAPGRSRRLRRRLRERDAWSVVGRVATVEAHVEALASCRADQAGQDQQQAQVEHDVYSADRRVHFCRVADCQGQLKHRLKVSLELQTS